MNTDLIIAFSNADSASNIANGSQSFILDRRGRPKDKGNTAIQLTRRNSPQRSVYGPQIERATEQFSNTAIQARGHVLQYYIFSPQRGTWASGFASEPFDWFALFKYSIYRQN